MAKSGKTKSGRTKRSGSRARAVAGGGRAVEVAPERLRGWFERFAERNDGIVGTELDPRCVTVWGGSGTTASVAVPFGPLPAGGRYDGSAVQPLIEHMLRRRRIGLVLVRLGGHSVGIADGDRIVASRTDRKPVHGRNSAGGWSQQRFARRRQEQARQELRAAAGDAAEVVASRIGELDAVVLGGDRGALDELGADSRLRALFAMAEPRVLDVAEPRRAVLDEAARRARSVEIVLRDA